MKSSNNRTDMRGSRLTVARFFLLVLPGCESMPEAHNENQKTELYEFTFQSHGNLESISL